jgi:hypothetical protein
MPEDTPLSVNEVVALLKRGQSAYGRFRFWEGNQDKPLVQLDNEWLLEMLEPVAKTRPNDRTLFHLDVDDSLILNPLGL